MPACYRVIGTSPVLPHWKVSHVVKPVLDFKMNQ
jgi:hypothetical protein